MHQQQEEIIPSLSLFISYAHEDEALRGELEKHLSLLQRKGMIATWHDRQILPGANWSQEIDSHLNTAALILLLISPDFLASDYCYGIEMHRALERHRAGTACVIPIILRPVDWHDAPFADLQCLPRDAQPVTRHSDRDDAWLTVAIGIRTVIKKQQRLHLTPSHKRENRERLLKRVQVFWIEGVLEQSLYHTTRIELDLQEQPNALGNPWRLTVQDMNQAPRLVATGTPLMEIYDAAGGELLILGEPGAGKTTLLLGLARDLIARADQNDTFPIPVVFNLSSWGEKHDPLARWLIEELESKYQVPRKLGQVWIAQERILPLLDGLDEVKQEARSVCIAAVNVYRTQYQQTSLVVCSRTTEYFAQEQRLIFLRAVTIQPLTAQQIDAYLASAGEQLEAVRQATHTSMVLHDLVTTPLLLNILVLAYQGRSLDDLQRATAREIQQWLFAMYIQRMLKRRGSDPRFSEQQTIRWLSWLAQQMAEHSQSTFFIERMQPTWLPSRLARWGHRIIVGLTVMLLWLLVGLLLGLSIEAFGGLSDDLYVTLIIGFIVGFISLFSTEIKPAERVTWSWKKALRGCGCGLGISLLVFLLLIVLTEEQLCVITMSPGARQTPPAMCSPSASGLLIIFLVDLFLGLFSALLIMIASGTSGSTLEKNMFMKPNEGIQISAQNSLRYGVSTMLVVGSIVALSIGVIRMQFSTFLPELPTLLSRLLSFSIPIWLLVSVPLGLFVGLACIRHIILRCLLWRLRFIPRNYPQFLDYAAERIFLRKVGGGYIFVHGLLLDYFSSLNAYLLLMPPLAQTKTPPVQTKVYSDTSVSADRMPTLKLTNIMSKDHVYPIMPKCQCDLIGGRAIIVGAFESAFSNREAIGLVRGTGRRPEHIHGDRSGHPGAWGCVERR